MADVAKIEIPVTLELSTEQIAAAFCDLDDDAQAQFFVHVARLFQSFPTGGTMQTLYIAHHLRDCECSTIEARDWVKDLAESMLESRRAPTGEET